MFGENDQGAEAGSEFPDEAGVGGEPHNVAFVATVEEDGAHTIGTDPVIEVDEVTLPERGEIGEAEMVEGLFEITDIIRVLLWQVLGFV